MLDQTSEQIVDIRDWSLDEEFGIFPVGSKPKRAAFCPTPAPYPFLIGGHRYLFKVSKDWRILQHWSEVIAYALARLVHVSAAPCFVAIDSRAEEVGVLVEFFYGHPGSQVFPRLISGADLLRRRVEDYDRDPDRHHTIGNILLLSRSFSIEDRLPAWGRFLVFDALIGNTDRHPENWGFLATKSQHEDWTFSLAPSFDHGTSLAYQIRNDDLRHESTEERMQLFLKRGQHHARWSGADPERGHFRLCSLFARSYPQAIPAMVSTLDFSINDVKEGLERCSRFDLTVGGWIEERSVYVSKLISARRQTLRRVLGA
jgi:hypothetical protein